MSFSDISKNNSAVEVHIYDMMNAENRHKGMELMREEVDKSTNFTKTKFLANKNVRVIAGGGDGTVMWVVEEMKKHKISFPKCPLGTIPFGTGNDFSRVIGWGGTII